MTGQTESDRPNGEPRYAQVAAELKAAILSGSFSEGDQLPTESVLCDRYAVSRFTVREALRRLQADGLIRRRRGSGTIVERRGGVLRQSLSDVSDLLQYAAGSLFDFSLHGTVTMNPSLARVTGAPAGSRWLHLSGVRSIDGTPIAFSDVYVTPELERYVRALTPGPETLFDRLARAAGFRVDHVQQDIAAVLVGGREAAALGMARRAPALRIVRAYVDDSGRNAVTSVSVHPGDRYTYSIHIDQR